MIDTEGRRAALQSGRRADAALPARHDRRATAALSTRLSCRRRHAAAAREMPSARVLRGEAFDAQEIVVRPAAATAPVHLVVSGRPLRDASGAISGAALVYHDITASRETEHKLQQSQKLDAIGKLTGGVAHDFNNMLTVITGTTETLVASLKDQPALQKTAELIDQAAERCIELIQHLLAFARRQPLHPRNVDINATVLDIAKTAAPDARRADRDQLDPRAGSGDRPYRRLAARQLRAQHGDQRPRRDAERRQAAAGDPQRRARRGLCAGQSRRAARSLRDARGQRHRHRHVAGGAGQGVRAVLHHQGSRQGLRPRPEHGLRLRQAVRRAYQDLQRGRPRHHDQALSAAGPRPGRGGPGRGRAAGARHRDHPGGGGRRAGAQLRHRATAEPRLQDARRRRRPVGAGR